MKPLEIAAVGLVASLIVAGSLFLVSVLSQGRPEAPAFDCRALIGGWHPDVPKEVSAKCRGKAWA